MKIGRYDFSITAHTRICLGQQPFTFVLRSGLGNVLKKLTCVLKNTNCNSCILKNSCIYALCFESIPTMAGAPDGLTELPKPYIFSMHSLSNEDIEEGQTINFSINFFGEANRYLPYFVHSIIKLGEIGIGKKIGSRRGQFKLDKVICGDNLLFDKTGTLKPITNLPEISLTYSHPQSQKINKLTIKYLTPIRIKEHNRLTDELPFFTLFNAIFRRIAALEFSYGENNIIHDNELCEKARVITISDATLLWKDFDRYSGRQKTAMKLGGVVGYATYQGNDLQDFLPFLNYVEQVHVGKQTVFGFGKIEVLV